MGGVWRWLGGVLVAACAGAFAGCFNLNGKPLHLEIPKVPPQAMATIVVQRAGVPAGIEVCADFRIEHAQDDFAVLAATGDPETAAATVEEARADGAICGSAAVDEEDLVFRGACDPSAPNAVRVWIEGEYVDGARHPNARLSCADGCRITFDCSPSGEPESVTVVDIDAFPDTTLGFFDVNVAAVMPPGASDVCIDVRVTDQDGEVAWSAGNPSGLDVQASEALCSSRYGNGAGALSFVAPCDAWATSHTVTLWVKSVSFDPSIPIEGRAWVNPCPEERSPAYADRWRGGCSFTLSCVDQERVRTDIQLDLVHGTHAR